MKNLIALMLIFVSLQNISIAQKTFINPGVKLGYQFGENGGFSLGFEISFTFLAKDGAIYGVLFDLDKYQRRWHYHFGLEFWTHFAGVEIGPTFCGGNISDWGFGTTVYSGAVLYPYYRYTFMNRNPNLNEIGTYIKFPILTSGGPFKM